MHLRQFSTHTISVSLSDSPTATFVYVLGLRKNRAQVEGLSTRQRNRYAMVHIDPVLQKRTSGVLSTSENVWSGDCVARRGRIVKVEGDTGVGTLKDISIHTYRQMMEKSIPLYAPGKLTVAGDVLPPPLIDIWAHSICEMLLVHYIQFINSIMLT